MITKKDIAQILEIVKDGMDKHLEGEMGEDQWRSDVLGKENVHKEIETKLEEMRKQRKP